MCRNSKLQYTIYRQHRQHRTVMHAAENAEDTHNTRLPESERLGAHTCAKAAGHTQALHTFVACSAHVTLACSRSMDVHICSQYDRRTSMQTDRHPSRQVSSDSCQLWCGCMSCVCQCTNFLTCWQHRLLQCCKPCMQIGTSDPMDGV